MASRTDFYFRQRVSEAELDLAFELLERADRDLAADLGIHGVVSGAFPAPHTPVADLTIDLTAPGRAYDNLGQRIFFGTGQTVDCSVDLAGVPTAVTVAGNERWLGVFMRFRRLLSDPRTDGNSQQVFFRRDESFEIVVRQAPDGPIGSAPRPPLEPGELLVCEVRRRPGQTQIVAADIDVTRRQAFIFAQGNAVAISAALWTILAPLGNTVQAALDEVDAELRDHFTAAARRHAASAIDSTPHGFIASTNVQAALNELVDDLGSSAAGSAGALRVGADAVAGSPNALPAGTVDAQLAQLLSIINSHVSAIAGAHSASAIAAAPHGFISSTNVQAQLQELVTDLRSTVFGSSGAGFIGLADPLGLVNSTDVENAIQEILQSYDNEHFRDNEPGLSGMHRTITQPALGAGRVLLWDAQGNGTLGARMRVYADGDAVWFIFNASWNGSLWVRDTSAVTSGGFRVGRAEFEILHQLPAPGNFSTFTRTVRFPLSDNVQGNTGLVATGTVREIGKCGSRTRNFATSEQLVAAGHGVTFRVVFPAVPSSLTFTPQVTSPIVPTVGAVSITTQGFGFFFTATTPGQSQVQWFGTYLAIA